MRSRSPRAILATLPVLASLAAIVVALVSGVFGPVDRAALDTIGELWPDAPLQSSVAVVELDDAVIETLGPPPWSAATWIGIAGALSQAGIDEAALVDDPARLIDPRIVTSRRGPTRSGARLIVPGASDVPSPLAARPHLALRWTDDPRGLGDGARAAGWCAWSRCPVGSTVQTPLRPAELSSLPRFRLSEIVKGNVRASLSEDTQVFLGFPTGSTWAATWPAGDPVVQLSRADAAALALATLRSRSARPLLPFAVLVPLAALLVLLGAMVAHAEPGLPAAAWILLLPIAVLTVSAMLAVSGVLLVPPGSLVVAVILGAVAEALRLRSRMAGFFRRMGHRLAEAETDLPRSPDPSPQALLQQLAALTWNHLPTERMLYICQERGQVRIVGGFGVSEESLAGPLTVSRLNTLIGRCDDLIAEEETAAGLTEVRWHGRTAGWWLVVWDARFPGPDLERMQELARWATDAAPLQPVRGAVASLLRTDAQIEALEAAFERRHRAGARRRHLLRSVPMPLAIADRAGTIVFQNDAFELVTRGICPRSVRELVYRADGSEGLSLRMRAVFDAGESFELAWVERGVRIVLSPGADGARSGVLVRLEPLRAATGVVAAK